MMKSCCFFLFILFCYQTQAQDLYIRSFGKPADPAVIFLHGGPGYNAASFEGTTAKRLSENGLFVIVYDRRGEGRSTDPNADFTFKEAIADIDYIYRQFGLKRASLIGHSFGGVVGLQFASVYPAMVNSLILVGAPVNLQASFQHVIARSRKMFTEKNDSVGLKRLSYIEKLDPASLMYSSSCFQLAIQNGSYSTQFKSTEAEAISTAFRKDTILLQLSRQMTMPAVSGFWKNEQYTTLDLSSRLEMFRATNVRVYGLYGKEDGLYSDAQVNDMKKRLGENQVLHIEQCSHSVFIDQQDLFIRKLSSWCR